MSLDASCDRCNVSITTDESLEGSRRLNISPGKLQLQSVLTLKTSLPHFATEKPKPETMRTIRGLSLGPQIKLISCDERQSEVVSLDLCVRNVLCWCEDQSDESGPVNWDISDTGRAGDEMRDTGQHFLSGGRTHLITCYSRYLSPSQHTNTDRPSVILFWLVN